MKFVILFALVAVVASQSGLFYMINVAVHDMMASSTDTLTVEECTTRCNATFNLSTGFIRDLTVRLCGQACQRELHGRSTLAE